MDPEVHALFKNLLTQVVPQSPDERMLIAKGWDYLWDNPPSAPELPVLGDITPVVTATPV